MGQMITKAGEKNHSAWDWDHLMLTYEVLITEIYYAGFQASYWEIEKNGASRKKNNENHFLIGNKKEAPA